ncbi:MAG: ribonuclease HI [Candidatus Midichloria mitochondrii]|uniref:Ribonuclease H n=1 Tax=Midichloria mitochondrii (strain IricVA) TaxID=696127 RepID=F7XTW1_MIDMI|nr:ribonuclease HI [Candidatus Midichloria mitochondrii]AEI89320.1 ribonuclease H [Candidatus Midichloria mitochondrii IricVA]MDJ1256496.1 ribonuclease HI [Candidatus Midichloria mitochondrii]MDJ1288211.1 ribonuclease HI [Candidatus Midichloria mitochondrii]MDJ1299035.1 ribonuclease HI [Candidatus Midichloria mitochondrii]MDJ1313236.1 ribonuclease HI [Candidatus Midichloria mitochondrii]
MFDILKIYCDGACSGNPGKGGWGAILIWKDTTKAISGFEENTTNNRMELTAAIEALKVIKRNVKVEVYTDSKYVCNGITNWIQKWKKNNWRNKNKLIKNVDLWQELELLSSKLDVSWRWIRGHNGDVYNEKADKLATTAIRYGK